MNNFFKNIIEYIRNNLKFISIILLLILLITIIYNVYLYLQKNNLEKKSVIFFETIEKLQTENLINDLSNLNNNKDFYSILSILKEIEIHNSEKNYSISLDLYKNLIDHYKLDNLYVSAISSKASFTAINALLTSKETNYIEYAEYFISKILNSENYYPIKQELTYLLAVTKLNINNENYSNNNDVKEIYNNIINSENIPISIKDRVRKINEYESFK